MLEIEGERIVDAPPERVFDALTDHDVVASAIPIIRSYREIDDDHWEAKVKAPLPFAPSVTIRFQIVERRPHEHASILSDGRGAHVQSSFDLTPDGDGRTRVLWRARIELTGLLAPFGGHGLEPLARRAAERVLDRVAAQAS